MCIWISFWKYILYFFLKAKMYKYCLRIFLVHLSSEYVGLPWFPNDRIGIRSLFWMIVPFLRNKKIVRGFLAGAKDSPMLKSAYLGHNFSKCRKVGLPFFTLVPSLYIELGSRSGVDSRIPWVFEIEKDDVTAEVIGHHVSLRGWSPYSVNKSLDGLEAGCDMYFPWHFAAWGKMIWMCRAPLADT